MLLWHATSTDITVQNISREENVSSINIAHTNLARCQDGSYIIDHHKCDGKQDCVDGTDEENCTEVCNYPHRLQNLCYDHCHAENCSCLPMYFQCMVSGGCIPQSKICDCFADCHDSSDESTVLCSYTTCQLLFQSPKQSEYAENTLGEILSKVRQAGPIMTWHQEQHVLGEVQKAHFFCAPFYIYSHQICDGHRDCPHGEDEQLDCSNLSISPSLRCPRERLFVARPHIADGSLQCPLSFDDELVKLFNHDCRNSSCTCSGFAVACTNGSVFPSMSRWTRVFAVMDINSCNNITQHLVRLLFGLNHLLIIDIQNVDMKSTDDFMFFTQTYLTILKLSNARLQNITKHTFVGLSNLRTLNLRGNMLQVISNYLFANLTSLESLDISSNRLYLKEFHLGLFLPLIKMRKIYVDDSSLCCLVPAIACYIQKTSTDIFSSCQAIIPYLSLQAIITLTMGIILLGNIISFFWQFIEGRNKYKAQHLFLISLTFSDGLMSAYLAILLIANMIYKGDMVYVVFAWKDSVTCTVAGMIMLISIESSTLSTLLIAIDRFVCIVVNPLKKTETSLKVALTGILVSWFICLSINIVPFIVHPVAITNSACMIVGSSLPLLHAILHLTINSATFLTLGAIYPLMIKTIYTSSTMSTQSKWSAKKVVFRLGLIILSNFISWATISFMSVMSLCGYTLFPTIESILGLSLFPLNAFFNPFMNTLISSGFLGTFKASCFKKNTLISETKSFHGVGQY